MEFDTKVQHRDGKSGKVIKVTPYVYRVSREHGETYIRDNVEYYPNGEIKRDMRPKAVAPAPAAPEPLKVSAPVNQAPLDPIGSEEAQEAALGVPSTEALMATAETKPLKRGK